VLQPDVLTGHGDIATLLFRNQSQDAITIQLRPGPSGDEAVAVSLERSTVAPGSVVQAHISVGSDLVLPLESTVRFVTTHAREREIAVKVDVYPQNCIQVIPSRIDLGVPTKSELIARAPIEVWLEGGLLAQAAVNDVRAPPYLRFGGVTKLAEERWSLRFPVSSSYAFTRTDLSGEIAFRLSSRTNTFRSTVVVPVSGLLLSPD